MRCRALVHDHEWCPIGGVSFVSRAFVNHGEHRPTQRFGAADGRITSSLGDGGADQLDGRI
jgi:hypothetical protein